jgi:DNA-binding MarR family transcriptional regulator
MSDPVQAIVDQWAVQRPDIDVTTMADVARLLRVPALIDQSISAIDPANGMDRGQGDVLFTLRRSGPPYRLSPGALTANLLVTTGTMTNRIDRLEARGLVRRLPHPDDRRSVVVELTPEAVELVDRAIERHVASEQEMIAPLTERDRAELRRILRKLLAHLGA